MGRDSSPAAGLQTRPRRDNRNVGSEIDDLLRDSGSLRRGNFRYLPVAPGRLEFALEVRRAILTEKPRVVAVELPATLEAAYLQAVARLPQLTVLVYPDAK